MAGVDITCLITYIHFCSNESCFSIQLCVVDCRDYSVIDSGFVYPSKEKKI